VNRLFSNRNQFPFIPQLDSKDCGIACLRMISKYYGKSQSTTKLQNLTSITREGVSLLGISDTAEKIGLRSIGIKTTLEDIEKENITPFIAHWQQKHFVVVYKIKKNVISVSDPALGKINYTRKEFLRYWASTTENDLPHGFALLLKPTPALYLDKEEKHDSTSLYFLFQYLRPYKNLVIQLIIGLTLGSLLQLALPFLTQSIVDFGIANNNLSYIYLVLIAQMVLFISRMSVDFIRSWILLHISTRINISLISDFLIKLMNLPISFFDSKMTGDIMQRIGDHARIENFALLIFYRLLDQRLGSDSLMPCLISFTFCL